MIPTAAPTVPTLYHVPFFCSSIPYNAILELRIPPEKLAVNTLTRETLRTDKNLPALSPRRKAPFLTLPTGETIVEAGAILLYLCEQFDPAGKIYPLQRTPTRARFLQGVFYGVMECYRASDQVLFLCLGKDASSRDRGKLEVAKRQFEDVVVEHLVRELDGGRRKFYLGEEFSAADIAFSYPLMCAEFCAEGLLENEVVKEYHQRLKGRAAYQQLYGTPFSW